MKKKVILTISILLLIGIVVTSFSGCFLFGSVDKISINFPKKDKPEDEPKDKGTHSNVELLEAYQSLETGTVHLKIKYANMRSVEYTLNDGEEWRTLGMGAGYYYFSIDESYYGKQLNIAVRVPEDANYKASEKSNTITYLVKAPSKIEEKDLNDFYSTLEIREPIADTYKFVVEDNKVVLKRYYEDEDGDIVLQPVAEDDKIDVEYKIVATEDLIADGDINMAKSLIEEFDIQKDLEDENELDDLAKTILAFAGYVGIQDDNEEFSQWVDYDYDNGISNGQYAQSIVAGYDYKADNSICRVGNLFFMLARVKGNDTTLMSKTFIIKCWV